MLQTLDGHNFVKNCLTEVCQTWGESETPYFGGVITLAFLRKIDIKGSSLGSINFFKICKYYVGNITGEKTQIC